MFFILIFYYIFDDMSTTQQINVYNVYKTFQKVLVSIFVGA